MGQTSPSVSCHCSGGGGGGSIRSVRDSAQGGLSAPGVEKKAGPLAGPGRQEGRGREPQARGFPSGHAPTHAALELAELSPGPHTMALPAPPVPPLLPRTQRPFALSAHSLREWRGRGTGVYELRLLEAAPASPYQR